ncbi:hypothetical protein NS277_15875 [Novosphingobium barchaimii]|nr:hypothetical protein NS277_15875 [Novosphingobium barchaimii]
MLGRHLLIEGSFVKDDQRLICNLRIGMAALAKINKQYVTDPATYSLLFLSRHQVLRSFFEQPSSMA